MDQRRLKLSDKLWPLQYAGDNNMIFKDKLISTHEIQPE